MVRPVSEYVSLPASIAPDLSTALARILQEHGYAVNAIIDTKNKFSDVFGYSAGDTVTQATSRSTGVTINAPSGQITLVSAAGAASWTTFTVTNSLVSDSDVVVVSQKSGTDKYQTQVTRVADGVFDVTFQTTGGATTEQPVFTFAVVQGAAL